MRCLGAENYNPERREEWDEWTGGERLALQILGDCWGSVEHVANELHKRGTLRGEEIHAIVAEHKRRAKQIGVCK